MGNQSKGQYSVNQVNPEQPLLLSFLWEESNPTQLFLVVKGKIPSFYISIKELSFSVALFTRHHSYRVALFGKADAKVWTLFLTSKFFDNFFQKIFQRHFQEVVSQTEKPS